MNNSFKKALSIETLLDVKNSMTKQWQERCQAGSLHPKMMKKKVSILDGMFQRIQQMDSTEFENWIAEATKKQQPKTTNQRSIF